jgi:hypothetical protein
MWRCAAVLVVLAVGGCVGNPLLPGQPFQLAEMNLMELMNEATDQEVCAAFTVPKYASDPEIVEEVKRRKLDCTEELEFREAFGVLSYCLGA